MRRVTVSAPGKVILMGEHAVVYGKPAVAVAIKKRCRVSIQENSKSQTLNSKQIKKPKSKIQNDILVSIDSEIPVGRHLGSSAAWAVARVGVSLVCHGGELNLALVNDLAYEMEKAHHGNPSGVDNTVSTYGGVVWFQKGEGTKRLNMEGLEKFNSFWLVDTGKPKETTKEMVQFVNEEWSPSTPSTSLRINSLRVKIKNGELQKILDRNEEQTGKVVKALGDGDEKLLIEATREGERTLEELGVVSEMAKEIARKVERAGGAAKILGGGGRKGAVGMMLVYHGDPRSLVDLPMERVAFETEGVRREENKYQ